MTAYNSGVMDAELNQFVQQMRRDVDALPDANVRSVVSQVLIAPKKSTKTTGSPLRIHTFANAFRHSRERPLAPGRLPAPPPLPAHHHPRRPRATAPRKRNDVHGKARRSQAPKAVRFVQSTSIGTCGVPSIGPTSRPM